MGLHFERGLLLRLAGALVHLVVVEAAAGMAGVDGGEHFRGGRSCGLHGCEGHGARAGDLRRATGSWRNPEHDSMLGLVGRGS